MQAKKTLLLLILYLAGISGACLSNSLKADTVELNNGDRISGDITGLTSKSLTIKTTYTGTLTLDTLMIRSFQTTSLRYWQVNLKPQQIIIHESPLHGHVVIDGQTLAINELMLLPAHTDWKKSGLLEASLDVDNDQHRKEKLHVTTEFNLESRHWRHRVKAESKRDKERNQVTEDTFELNYTLDYLIDSHWLLRTDTTYREEGVDLVSQYWYLGGGPGYRFWGDGENKLDAIVTYNHLSINAGSIDWELEAWAFSLNYKKLWLDEKLETFSDIHYTSPLIDSINYILNSSSGLRYYFKHNFHISFKYDYNEADLVFGTIKDSSYVMGVGVNF